MIKSMTGYGRGEYVSGTRKVSIELKTVNHRYLDINIKLPKTLVFLEEHIRSMIQERIYRGRIEVYTTYRNIEQTDKAVFVDLKLAKEYLSKLMLLSDELGIKDDVTNTYIASMSDVIVLENQKEDEDVLKEVFSIGLDKALEQLIEMRKVEGEKLYDDIKKRCLIIKDIVNKIEERASVVPQYYKEKLEGRIRELVDIKQLDADRLEQEVAIIADRANIDEEITRLYSHLNQLDKTLDSSEPVGRKLDFIVQEMNREVNTIASKANDIFISRCVVDVKSEISKIREQVQNIE
ncbi:MAG: YicC family protein [Clostridia bacterium]|nr:YicC family protein [Clostridia bacterium]